MTAYLAFLRAINLGARRKFGKDDIVRVTTAAGCTDVATHINTGNVRLQTRLRSRRRLEEVLESAYLADRGFAVPTITYAVPEFLDLVADVDELGAGHSGQHHVCLLKTEVSAQQRADAERLGDGGERLVIRGRAAHLLIGDTFHGASLSNDAVEKVLGGTVATTRNARVIRAIAQKWC